jgi:hypothetical protein
MNNQCLLGWVIVLGCTSLLGGFIISLVGWLGFLGVLGGVAIILAGIALFSWGCILIQENCGK